MTIGTLNVSPTRYPELGYCKCAPGLWRIVDCTDDKGACIGPHYRTKGELLADLARYAAEFGAA